ncbi:ketopantoate reductase family protein [Emcibacter sp.]|uniref:ketopantoate reductase family protein n=1 Tax=Emcibacter sp. TaxID=1979954 RepID=UPI002AA65DF1|nr:ketopantoate reductase family protein [Emcibacter sp.]
MRILVLGAGAIGGYFGGLMLHSGADATFLVRRRRRNLLRKNGLVIHAPDQDYTIDVTDHLVEEVDRPFDLVILSCKAYDLEEAIQAISPAVGPDSHILPLLNGLRHYDILDETFGPDKILGGLAKNICTLQKDGSVRSWSRPGNITFGPRSDNQLAFCRQLEELLLRAPISVTHSSHIKSALWDKFCMITVLGAINCLLRGSIGDIMATRDGREIALAIISECARTAEAAGYPLSDASLEYMQNSMTRQGSEYTSSMFRDLELGKQVEGDQLVGDMLARATAAGLNTPYLKAAYCNLQTYMVRREKT